MSFRVVALGEGEPRALVGLYLVGAHLDERLRAALTRCTVVAFDDPNGERLDLTVRRAADAAGVESFGAVGLAGFSAGCLKGVRQRLREGARVDAVLAVDGTHASMPPEPWQLSIWSDLAAQAARGERLFVATHTQQTYVEHLRAIDGGPYLSTVSTLERVTTWDTLRPGGPLDAPAYRAHGEFHLYSYASAPIDGAAHGRQQTIVLPEMLRRHVGPWLLRELGAPTVRDPEEYSTPIPTTRVLLRRGDRGEDVRAWQERLHAIGYDAGALDGNFGQVTEAATRALQRDAGTLVDGIVGAWTRGAAEKRERASIRDVGHRDLKPANLAAAVLEQARASLAARAGEDPLGSDDGPYVRALFEGTGASAPNDWCAAQLSSWLRSAYASLGLAPTIPGSVGAQMFARQLEEAAARGLGRWHDASELRRDPGLLVPGMLVFWRRQGWRGHCGVPSRVGSEGRFWAVEGNSGERGDRVAEMAHRLDDDRLIGAGLPL